MGVGGKQSTAILDFCLAAPLSKNDTIVRDILNENVLFTWRSRLLLLLLTGVLTTLNSSKHTTRMIDMPVGENNDLDLFKLDLEPLGILEKDG